MASGATGPRKHPSLEYMFCAEEAAVKVLQSVCGAEIRRDGDRETRLPGGSDIASVVALQGDLEWSLWLAFPGPVAIGAIRELAGTELSIDSEEMADAMGELTEMIAEGTRARLGDLGLMVQSSLPSVISGGDLRIRPQHDRRFACACLKTQWGAVWVEVCAGVKVGARQAGRP